MMNSHRPAQRFSFVQSSAARSVLRRLAHAFEAGGLTGVGHTVQMLRTERRIQQLQAAVDWERGVHSDRLHQLQTALNAQIGQQQQTRIVAVTHALARLAGRRQRLVRGVRS